MTTDKNNIMVKYDYILKVIEDYTVKCPTISEIREKLKYKKRDDKFHSLKEKGLLTPLEEHHYDSIVHMIGWYRQMGNFNFIDDCEEMLFQYEKRLLNGYKPREPQVVDYDESQYVKENPTSWDNDTLYKFEKQQIQSQEGLVFTDDECDALHFYFGDGYVGLNSKLNDGREWNARSESEREHLKSKINKVDRNLEKAISKSRGLTQDTTLFYGGILDPSIIVGSDIKFKNYLSTTYQESVAVNYVKSKNHMIGCVYKLLLPKGYKGLCANAEYYTDSGEQKYSRMTKYAKEHEYVLPKNSKFKVVDIKINEKASDSDKKFSVTLVPV